MNFTKTSLLILTAATLLLAGCAATQPQPYAGVQSSPQLRANTGDDADKIPYAYAPPVRWANYKAVWIEPVAVYAGADNQFDGLSDAEKTELARDMQSAFEKSLRARFQIVNAPTPGALRLRLTLTGAKTNTAVVSTVTRFDLAGGPINIVQGIRGKEGVFIGSVNYSAEVFDATDNRLLKAFIAKQYPNAMNVGATVGRLAAAKTGIDKGAEDMLKQLQ
ncbi:MAG: hypothetical protein GAK30_02007 [Paracidovorax wautersii]|uniref:DUF3313 domain-containing protein n=1 Tax=Paracidovorax wautersii TaxID=1177982 RepID=A0A7V8FNW2_9BURK|nr:MAG: hypothetical protein GAK30_02007 [Paracidovorax wautersii]